MSYCTKQNLIARFGKPELEQLTDRDLTGYIDDVVLNQAITDVDAVIDGHIGGRYTLPLVTVPDVLVTNACDMVRYRLYKDGAPDEVSDRNRAALRYLERIQEGKATLGEQETSEDRSGGQVTVGAGQSRHDWSAY
ncbi:MAG TPA: DUF1320 domain-containing protein [Gammaproteobacteria bacterium]|nr:DUF1320 domain-containing protein [Gammaproteobacteria bacterium]